MTFLQCEEKQSFCSLNCLLFLINCCSITALLLSSSGMSYVRVGDMPMPRLPSVSSCALDDISLFLSIFDGSGVNIWECFKPSSSQALPLPRCLSPCCQLQTLVISAVVTRPQSQYRDAWIQVSLSAIQMQSSAAPGLSQSTVAATSVVFWGPWSPPSRCEVVRLWLRKGGFDLRKDVLQKTWLIAQQCQTMRQVDLMPC